MKTLQRTPGNRWVFYLILVIGLAALMVWYFGFTGQGMRRLLVWTAQHYLHPGEVSIGSVRGNLFRGLTVNEIHVTNTRYLSIPHTVGIQQMDARWLGGAMTNVEINVKQGSLKLSNSKPVRLDGTYAGRKIDMRLQALSVDILDLAPLSPQIHTVLKSGRIEDLDMKVSGDLLNPSFAGTVAFAGIQTSPSVSIERIRCGHVEGILSQYVHIRQIEVQGIARAPEGSVVRVQDVRVNYEDQAAAGPAIVVKNARLQLKNSDVIVLSGKYARQTWDVNIFSKAVDAQEILGLLPQSVVLKTLKGSLSNIDLYVRGPGNALSLEGKFVIEEFLYSGFAIHQTATRLNMRFHPDGALGKVTGTAEVEGGKFMKSKAVMDILPSRFSFNGDIKDPALDVHATTTVDKTKIQITVQGTRSQPNVILESDPPRSREMLMVMVATGQSWKRSSKAIEEGVFTPDVAKDFVDYLLFNGQGTTLAQRLGLDSLSFTLDGETKGVSASKSLTDQLSVNYGVERPQVKPGEVQNIKHQIGGQVQVTNKIAVEASKSVVQSAQPALVNEQPNQSGEADIKLKYQTKW